MIYLVRGALVKLISPILSFTAEEIWKHMPHKSSDNKESIFLNDICSESLIDIDDKFIADWDKIHKIRDEIKKVLEIQRKNKVIGSSLEAEISIFADGKLYGFINEHLNELKSVLIVSGIKIENSGEGQYKVENLTGLSIDISHSVYNKCERCWTYDKTVGEDPENPTICARCAKVVKE